MSLFSKLFGGQFDNPCSMTSENLLSAIAGQADWLEKMNKFPIATQQSASIIELASRRRSYIGNLCLEVISRGCQDDNNQPKYPGSSKSINVFFEASEYAVKLEDAGLNKELAVERNLSR